MEESFTITITLHDKEQSFDTRLVAIGYTHRFIVLINGLEVMYEPDEERKYRAIVTENQQHTISDLDRELIRAVGEKIEAIR